MDRVRHLQRRLYVAAKRSPERRFHALYDRIFRPDVLAEAWRRVRANRGAAGVDRETLADVEAYGPGRMLGDLSAVLQAGRYHPSPVRQVGIPKPDGGVRVLIADINPVLRGWGAYFRTGNAADKFRQIDRYVTGRLRGFLVKRQGRHLRPGQITQWTEDWFNGLGLYRLRGTVRYPEAA